MLYNVFLDIVHKRCKDPLGLVMWNSNAADRTENSLENLGARDGRFVLDSSIYHKDTGISYIKQANVNISLKYANLSGRTEG